MFKQGKILLVPMLLASMLSSCHSGTSVLEQRSCPARTSVEQAAEQDTCAPDLREPSQTAFSEPYTLSVYPSHITNAGAKEGACLRITNGAEIKFELAVPYEDNLEMLTTSGVVLNKGGTASLPQLTTPDSPNFVLLQRSPAHGTKCSVYSMASGFPLVATFNLDGGTAQLEPLEPGSEKARLVITDWYKEWGIQPVAADVVLKWSGTQFVVDGDEMRARCRDLRTNAGFKSAMSEMFETVDRSSDLPINHAPPEVSEQIIALTYAGKLAEARTFLNEVWPKSQPDREKYWQFMLAEIKKSSFWPQIKKLNHLK